mgnify:CR=1 FL=1
MTTVAPTHAYPDGSTLSATGHANNMYSSTPQQGLYSAVNGELDFSANYTGQIKRHNFQVSEMFFFDQYKWERPVTVFSDTGGGSELQGASGGETGDPAATIIGLRFSLPAPPKYLRIGYSFFLSAARAFKVDRPDAADADEAKKWSPMTNGSLEARLMVFFNGAEKEALRIPLPKTLWGGVSNSHVGQSKGTSNHLTSYEHLTAQQHSGSFIVRDDDPGGHKLHHNLQFKLFLENPATNGEFTDVFGKKLGLIGKEQYLKLKISQRLTFGCGQVNVVAKGLKTS